MSITVPSIDLPTTRGRLSGVQVVFQTPFTASGAVDYATLDAEIDWLFANGANGVVFAMVSELLRLSSEERDAISAAVARRSMGRGDCVLSVGAESIDIAIRHSLVARDAGATAVMAAPPTLFRVDDDSLFRYFVAIANAAEVELVVQDASGYVGAPLSIDLQRRLQVELGDRVSFKPEAHPIGPRLTQLRDATDGAARVFEGTGGLYLIDSYRRGAIGTMPAGDLVWALVPLWNALQRGDYAAAYRIGGPLAQIVSLQTSLDTFVAIEKRNLVRQGVFRSDFMRQPADQDIDPQMLDEVDRLVDRLREAVQGA